MKACPYTQQAVINLIEVSLIRDRSQSEMIPIARHLKELIKNSTDIREKFSVFVTPNIHDDAKEYAEFA